METVLCIVALERGFVELEFRRCGGEAYGKVCRVSIVENILHNEE